MWITPIICGGIKWFLLQSNGTDMKHTFFFSHVGRLTNLFVHICRREFAIGLPTPVIVILKEANVNVI